MHEREWFEVRAACWWAVCCGCVGVAYLRSAIAIAIAIVSVSSCNDGWQTLIHPWLEELEFDPD